jgi:hypothetical protein
MAERSTLDLRHFSPSENIAYVCLSLTLTRYPMFFIQRIEYWILMNIYTTLLL